MKITVLGCGALGQLWLSALCKHGHDVQGWLRVPQPYCSVNLIDTDGSFFNESLTANDPDFLAKSELLLVTLKAWQVSDAVRTLFMSLTVLRILARRASKTAITVISPISCRGYCPMSPGITISAQRCGANWRSTVLSTRSPRFGTARTASCAIILMKSTRFAKRSPP